jgi:hypothetical protein
MQCGHIITGDTNWNIELALPAKVCPLFTFSYLKSDYLCIAEICLGSASLWVCITWAHTATVDPGLLLRVLFIGLVLLLS